MASFLLPHPRTTTTTICSTSTLLLLNSLFYTSLIFYCCKWLLGRNSTATTSAPHEGCQHLLRGALPLSTAWRTSNFHATSCTSPFSSPLLKTFAPLRRPILVTSLILCQVSKGCWTMVSFTTLVAFAPVLETLPPFCLYGIKSPVFAYKQRQHPPVFLSVSKLAHWPSTLCTSTQGCTQFASLPTPLGI